MGNEYSVGATVGLGFGSGIESNIGSSLGWVLLSGYDFAYHNETKKMLNWYKYHLSGYDSLCVSGATFFV